MKRNICPGCDEREDLTRHHIYPLRHWPDSNHIGLLCDPCHSELEGEIRNREKEFGGKLPKNTYLQIFLDFISKKRGL
jgi:hypothetical protein